MESNQDHLPYIWEAPPMKKKGNPPKPKKLKEEIRRIADDDIIDVRPIKRLVKQLPPTSHVRMLVELEEDQEKRRDILAKMFRISESLRDRE
jgi:hypothetical protein